MVDLLPLFLFVVVMVGTPGPANMVLMTAGARFGYKTALPFLLGITTGKLILNLCFGIGAFSILLSTPILLKGLKYISALYMIWLSYRLAQQPFGNADHHMASIPGFKSGLIVHPLNPKAWAMMVIAWSDYGSQIDDDFMRIITIGGTFMIVQLFAHSFWCLAGERLISLIRNDNLKAQIQKGLALLTVLVVLAVLI